MSAQWRLMGRSVPFHTSSREATYQHRHIPSSLPMLRTAFLHTTSGNSNKNSQDNTTIWERAIKAREPNYAGWWTEILNYRTAPQSSIDPSATSISANKVISTPSPEEIKKGYVNTLPTAKTIVENTLPRAASTGSSTFTTGSALSTPRAESIDYHGFKIPIKPTPPGAEDCCMSGCAHCIYDIYEEDRQEYSANLAKVLDEISKAGLPPPDIGNKTKDGDGAQSTNSDDDMDPGMKAFLELERKLKGS
ncbi:hypothetical protein FBU30_005983 [Linnemannia zychae]|nr:hypothetical protein FBU30_005983 [Linnemannia zychae]